MVDASVSSIDSREAASLALRELACRDGEACVVIYVPKSKTVNEEQKQVSPFTV